MWFSQDRSWGSSTDRASVEMTGLEIQLIYVKINFHAGFIEMLYILLDQAGLRFEGFTSLGTQFLVR